MDPYLEPHWLDVHTALIGEARRFLNRSLPAGLVARAEERLAIESAEDYVAHVRPDVQVFAPSTADPTEGASGFVIEAPYKLVVELDPLVERFIRIIDESGTLISVIEFLSPSNKRPPGLEDYRAKRGDLLAAHVHVVEIDLTRAGDWRALMRPEHSPPEAVSYYRAIVRTAIARPTGYLFPIGLRHPLPEIPIPLRSTDAPVKMPLQSLFDAVYQDGRYGQTIDYSKPLDPPLNPDDDAWAHQLLKSAAKR